MAHWMVQLEGDRFDLEEYPRHFPDGDVYAIDDGERVFLVGPALEVLAEASQVRETAMQVVDEFFAITSLLDDGLRRPEVAHVYRDNGDGTRMAFVHVGVTASARVKAHAVVVGADAAPDSPTAAQVLHRAANADAHLRMAVTLWADPLRTWPRLYRILEEVEQCLGCRVDDAGSCSGAQRERFTRSANTAEVSGADARHASGKFTPPADPMSLGEATAFVGGLLKAALDAQHQ